MRFFSSPELADKTAHIAKLPLSEFPLRWNGKSTGMEAAESDWVVNTFDGTIEELDIVPVARKEPWETIPLHAETFSPQLILGIFPAYLQLGIRFHSAIRALPMGVCSVAEEQMRAGIALMEPLHIGGIVLTQSALVRCVEQMRSLAPAVNPYMQVILSPHEKPLPTERKRVLYEVHLVPGMVGLFQCQHLAGPSPIFHPSKRFVWEHDGQTLAVSDVQAGRFSRVLWPTPVVVSEETCRCGNDLKVTIQ